MIKDSSDWICSVTLAWGPGEGREESEAIISIFLMSEWGLGLEMGTEVCGIGMGY